MLSIGSGGDYTEEKVIQLFEEFITRVYYDKLARAVNLGEPAFYVDFLEMDRFDPNLSDLLVDNPQRLLDLFKQAIKNIEITEEYEFTLRFTGFPEDRIVRIRDVRSKHLGKLTCVEGLVKQASDVRPIATVASFECPACGMVIDLPQTDTIMHEPSICSCGRKGKFKMIGKKLVDTQRIIIEEAPETIIGEAQPRRIAVFLTEDLVEPKIEKKTSPGTRVAVVGIVREVAMIERGGMKTTKFDLIVSANSIETVEHEYEELTIEPEEEEKIKELASNPEVYKMLRDSIAPSIWGMNEIKEAIVLQLFGGVKTPKPDKTFVRGDMHMLLVGDPGVAKSQLLKYVSAVSPKARYVSGKGSSGAGLTAAVVKDEFLKGWALEAGALVLANKGIACIDEIDKMESEDRSAMHEAMEQQTISISKANINSTLRAETTILAAANPKLSRFDPYQPIAAQIDMPASLISRFDLIFALRDLPDKTKDTRLATHILEGMKSPEKAVPVIEPVLMKKFIAYAKKNCKPKLSAEAIDLIRTTFVSLRNRKGTGTEEGVQSIALTARQLEAMVRIATASAKVRLSEVVTKDDAQRSIDLVKYYLQQLGTDTETGEIDIDRIVTGITSSQRNRIITIRELVRELEGKYGNNIPLADLIDAAKAKGVDETKIEEVIEKLKRDGELFEPKTGIIRRMPK